MESYIRFNVALNGSHFFATAPESCKSYDLNKAKQLAEVLTTKFPESEGYSLSVTRWEGKGQGLDPQALIDGRL